MLELKPRGFASGFDPSRVTQLSWHPRFFFLFFSRVELESALICVC